MSSTLQQTECAGELTENERVVFDQLLAHKKAKQIARDLGLSLSAVEERIRSGRQKLGAPDRSVAVRIYAASQTEHRIAVPMFEGVEPLGFLQEELIRELDGGPTFSLQDSQAWENWGRRRPLLETFDEKFGPGGRVVLIVVCFVVVCLTTRVVVDLFETMNRLL